MPSWSTSSMYRGSNTIRFVPTRTRRKPSSRRIRAAVDNAKVQLKLLLHLLSGKRQGR